MHSGDELIQATVMHFVKLYSCLIWWLVALVGAMTLALKRHVPPCPNNPCTTPEMQVARLCLHVQLLSYDADQFQLLTHLLQAELKMSGITNVGMHNLSPGMVTTDLLMSGRCSSNAHLLSRSSRLIHQREAIIAIQQCAVRATSHCSYTAFYIKSAKIYGVS